MNIELKEITVRELTIGYEDNEEGGVIGYGGKKGVNKKRHTTLCISNSGFSANLKVKL